MTNDKPNVSRMIGVARTCLVVLGMHRSGTSAITRCLSLLGARLPANILGPNTGNKRGHWEPMRLVQVHDELLAEVGSRWDDWREVNTNCLRPNRLNAYKERIMRIIKEEYGDASLLVMKDPRMSRLVTFYEDIFDRISIRPKYIVVVRNPAGVAASLRRRDGITEDYAYLVWLRHLVDAEIATRRRPRSFVQYEQLLRDWKHELHRVGQQICIDWPRSLEDATSEITAYLTPTLQHNVATLNDVDKKGTFGRLIKKAYTLALDVEATRNLGNAEQEFEKIAHEMRAFTKTAAGAVQNELITRGLLSSKIVEQLSKEQAGPGGFHDVSELELVYSSTSWRITAPLRNVKAIGKRIMQSPTGFIRRKLRPGFMRLSISNNLRSLKESRTSGPPVNSLVGKNDAYRVAAQPGSTFLKPTRVASACEIEPTAKPEAGSDNCLTGKLVPSPACAIVIHAYYMDVFDRLLALIEDLPTDVKLFVTCNAENDSYVRSQLSGMHHQYSLRMVENRGRDILPFLEIYPQIMDEGFEYILKVHTKKSPHRKDGELWREDMFAKLLGNRSLSAMREAFAEFGQLGIVGPSGHFVGWEKNFHHNRAVIERIADRLGLKRGDVLNLRFFAGTMFMARASALEPLLHLSFAREQFEDEQGQHDGTLAHGLERAFSLSVLASGKEFGLIDERGNIKVMSVGGVCSG